MNRCLTFAVLLLACASAFANEPTSQPASKSSDRVKIVVMPFEPLSADAQDDAALVRPMSRSLVDELSRSGKFDVVASTHEKGDSGAAVAEAKQIGARFAVSGTVQQVEGRVRVTGEVADADLGTSIGRFKITGDTRELFEIQDAVAEQVRLRIARAMRPRDDRNDAATSNGPQEIEPSEPLARNSSRDFHPDWLYPPSAMSDPDNITWRYNFSYPADPYGYWWPSYGLGYWGNAGFYSPYYRYYRPYRPLYANRYDDYTYRGLPDRRLYRDYGPSHVQSFSGPVPVRWMNRR